MENAMGNGGFLGLIIGIVVCVIFAVIAVKISKKDGAKLEEILSGISDEDKNLIKNQTFEATKDKNMFISKGYVASVETVEDTVQAVLIFYMENHQEFYHRNVKVKTSEAVAENLKKGNFVPVSMKYIKDMYYYDFKKLI